MTFSVHLSNPDSLTFRQAYGLWRAFIITTEDYSRSVCYVRDKYNDAVPCTAEEQRLVGLYFIKINHEVWEESQKLCIPAYDMVAARTMVEAKSYEALKRELEAEAANG